MCGPLIATGEQPFSSNPIGFTRVRFTTLPASSEWRQAYVLPSAAMATGTTGGDATRSGQPGAAATAPSAPASSRRKGFRPRSLLWIVPLALLLFIVVSDLFGWAYLRKPVAAFLSARLEREVEIDPPFRLHLRPSIPIRIGAVRIAAPDWSQQPHFAKVEGIEADVAWGALVGRQPVFHRLSVANADILAERDDQGRASWSMGSSDDKQSDDGPVMLPVVEELSVGNAHIDIKDAVNDLDVQLQASAAEGGARPEVSDAGGGQGASGRGALPSGANAGLLVTGKGTWKNEPVALELRTQGLRAMAEGGGLADIDAKARLRSTEVTFKGSIAELAQTGNVSGKVTASGPSLGELAAIPGLTLPSTPPYQLDGNIERSGKSIKIDVARAKIGSSSMTAKLDYDSSGAIPVLRGNLDASRLILQDLGPSIGAAADGDKGASGGKKKSGKRGSSRVLPTKEFNLPSLRAMDADVAIDLKQLDLGTETLRPLHSLKAQLLLQDGVLKLQDLTSDLAGGKVTGSTVLDGSAPDKTPAFDAKLKWNRVDLKTWVAVSGDYFVAGRFSGETLLKGSGKSTAAILESLGGTVKGRIDGGSISHQIVELAGLDAAQAIGVFFSGDKPLALSCALLDLVAEKGTVRSNLFLLNTPDTIFFIQGSVDFRKEGLDLRLVQSPKDWSPLSLRSPVTITGTMSNPSIGVEPMPIVLKVLSSVVLGAITPLAALLPLIETEDNQAREGCAPAIEQVRKRAAEVSQSPPAANEGSPRDKTRDANGTLRRPGRLPGERP